MRILKFFLISVLLCGPALGADDTHPRLSSLIEAVQSGNLGNVESFMKDKEWKDHIHQTDKDCRTPLHLAAAKGFEDIVKYLIKKGKASVNQPDPWGRTPLHSAARRGHLNVVKYLVEKAGADIESRDQPGDTPFNLARISGHSEVASWLQNQMKKKKKNSSCCIVL